jgi:hypothetical protein
MNRSPWKLHLKLWVPPLVFCLINLGFLAAYRLVLAEEAEIGRGLLDRREAELESLRQTRSELLEIRAQAEATEQGIEGFFAQRLSTEQERLTEVIAEIKDLAARAGLAPGAIRYERETISREDVVERTLVFDVTGSYSELRQLVNLLELSEYFLVLKEVSLRAADESGQSLGIELQIAVLFTDDDASTDESGGDA